MFVTSGKVSLYKKKCFIDYKITLNDHKMPLLTLSADFQHISLCSTKASMWSANLWVDDIHMRGKTKSGFSVC